MQLETVAKSNGLMLAGNTIVVAASVDNFKLFLSSVQRYAPSAQPEVILEFADPEDEALKKVNSLTRRRLKDVLSSRSLFLLPDPLESKCFINRRAQNIFKIKKKQSTTNPNRSSTSTCKLESLVDSPLKAGQKVTKKALKECFSPLLVGSSHSSGFKVKRKPTASESAEVSLFEDVAPESSIFSSRIRQKSSDVRVQTAICVTRAHSKTLPSNETSALEIQDEPPGAESKLARVVRLNKSCQKLLSTTELCPEKTKLPFKSEMYLIQPSKFPQEHKENRSIEISKQKVVFRFAIPQNPPRSQISNRSEVSISSQDTLHCRPSNQNPSIILDADDIDGSSIKRKLAMRRSHIPIVRESDRSSALRSSLASTSKFYLKESSPKLSSRSGDKKEGKDGTSSGHEEAEIDSQIMSKMSELCSAKNQKTSGSLRRILIDPIRKQSVVEHLSKDLISEFKYSSSRKEKQSDSLTSLSQKA